MKLYDVYRDGVQRRVNDMEIVSMAVLYGLRSNTTMSRATELHVNYKAAWQELDAVQEAWWARRED